MIKTILQYLLIATMTTHLSLGCAQNNNSANKITSNEYSLTFLLMNDEIWLNHFDTSISTVRLMLPNELSQILNSAKEQKGKDLNVIIKTSDMVQKATIDNIVERIKSQGIVKYLITKLSDKEIEKIVLAVADMKPPEPITITMPTSVVSQKLPDSNAFFIELKNDGTVWYKILSPETPKSSLTKIEKPVRKNLYQIIFNYEKKNSEIKKDYLIKGDNNTNYKTFEQVIEALKQNNILKYNLVASLSQ